MRRRQYILLALVLFVSMTSCLYYAIFGDFSFIMKTCFGIAAALLYAMINLIPFFAKRREQENLSLLAYLKTYINEIMTRARFGFLNDFNATA